MSTRPLDIIGDLADVSELLRSHAMALRVAHDGASISHELAVRRYEMGTLAIEGFVDWAKDDGSSRVWWIEAIREPGHQTWTVRGSLRSLVGGDETVLAESEFAAVSDDLLTRRLIDVTTDTLGLS